MSDSIRITLTAYNMGPDTTEKDFDAWTTYVSENVEKACGLPDDSIEIDQFDFANGPADDRVFGGTTEQRKAIREWLGADGWEAFCADASAWPKAAE